MKSGGVELTVYNENVECIHSCVVELYIIEETPFNSFQFVEELSCCHVL